MDGDWWLVNRVCGEQKSPATLPLRVREVNGTENADLIRLRRAGANFARRC
jgi:hypothetical protein